MSFPSLWLGLVLFIALFAIMGALNWRAQQKDPLLGQRRFQEGDVSNLFSYIFTPAWFFALTGSFPTTYAIGGIGLYIVTGIALWFALRAADLPREKRVVQTTCLGIAFMKLPHALGGCALALASTVTVIVFAVIAFNTARSADLGGADGLFSVAVWVFTIPAGVFFIITNLARMIQLWSRETPQQTRVQNFAMALRHYVLAAWTMSYPYIAFHRDLIEESPRLVFLAGITYTAAYFVLVVLPYGVGRTRFIAHSREMLGKLEDAVGRIVVATDPDVSDPYRRHIVDRVLNDLRSLITYVAGERPFFQYYLNKVSGHAGALAHGRLAGAEALALPQPDAKENEKQKPRQEQWDKLLDDHGAEIPEWDYRMYIITQIQELMENPHEKGWLRGSALAAKISVSRWLNRHYGKSVILGSIGVAASAAFAYGLQAYLPELRALAETAARSALSLGIPL